MTIQSRWLSRRVFGACCLALFLSGRPAHAQALLQLGNDPETQVAEEGPILDVPGPMPALASAVEPVAAAPAMFITAPATFNPPALDSAPLAPLPAVRSAFIRAEGATFGTPVEAAGEGTRLGAPLDADVLAVTPALIPVQYVPPQRRRDLDENLPDEGLLTTSIQLTFPGPQRLFRLDSEAAIRERIRQEARQRRTPDTIEFPEEQRFEARELVRLPRRWPLAKELVEPGYVWHGRLFFEQRNSERYGWDMRVVQPVISATHFYADVLTLPYHFAQDPWCRGDTNAGKCLPGDPVPLLLYPPQWSATGLGAEAAAVSLLFFVLP